VTRFDRFLTRAYAPGPGDLALFRVLWASWLLVDYLPRALWTPTAPRIFFSPPLGIPALLPEPLSQAPVLALEAAAATAALFLLLGCGTRAASLATAVLVLALDSVAFAFCGPSHTVLAYAVPAILAFSSWGERYSVDARGGGPRTEPERDAFLLAILAFVIGAAFFWAGAEKATSGWLDPERHATWGHLARTWVITERGTALTPWALGVELPYFWSGVDWVTLVFELALLPAFFFPRAFRVLLAVACLFHLGVYMLFGIHFAWNVAAYAAFVPWAALRWPRGVRAAAGRLAGRLAASSPRAWWLPCLLAGVVLTLASDPSPERDVLRRGADAAVLFGGAGIALAFLLGWGRPPAARS
jgi:hypothetical protein